MRATVVHRDESVPTGVTSAPSDTVATTPVRRRDGGGDRIGVTCAFGRSRGRSVLNSTMASRPCRAAVRATALLTAGPLLLAAGAGVAQERSTQFELTPRASYRFGGTFESEQSAATIDLDEGGAFGLAFNIRESANTQWEVIYAQHDTAADTSELPGSAPSTDLRLQYLHGGGTYEFDSRGTTRPYLVATVGGTHISPDRADLRSDTFWSFSIGTGLDIRATGRIGVRLEARLWGTLIESGSKLFCVSGVGGAACQIQLDGKLLYQTELSAGVTMRF